MVRPAVPDPPELGSQLWWGFTGTYAWDVGANCGQSIPYLRMFHGGRFTCFEPCRESYEWTKKLFFPDCDVRQVALSDHDGELELAFPGQEQRETGQLCTPGLKGMEWSPPDWSVIPTVTVPCRTADSLAAELGLPDFIKVDTEGHESYVLDGAAKILAEGTTRFLIEFHSPGNHSACLRALAAAGYSTETVRHPHYRERSKMWKQHGWIRAFPPETSRV